MKKTMRWLAFVMALLFALTPVSALQESMDAKYNHAHELLAEGKYEEAIRAFDEISYYSDSSKMAMYARAIATAEGGDYTLAKETFTLLGDYKDCPYMIIYYNGRHYESQASGSNWKFWLSAADNYDTLLLFRDSRERAGNCRLSVYNEAVARADAGQYDQSIVLLDALQDYSDSSILIKYYKAFLLEQQGSYSEASEAFATLGNYKDSAEQTQAVLKRAYEKADAAEKAGNQEEAYTIFMNIKNYEDSYDRACKPYYDLGLSKRGQGDWEGAVAAFSRVRKYSDSETQILATRYMEGKAKLAAKDWEGAISAFGFAGSYSDASTQILETRYQEGIAKREAQDWDGAIIAFRFAGSYNDAPNQILETRYQEGKAKQEAQDWEGAITAFKAAGVYSDAQTQILETYYLQAKNYYDSGNYSDAYRVYQQIAGYKDVDSLLSTDDHLLAACVEKRTFYETVGSIVTFGEYEQYNNMENGPEAIEWIVLEVQDGRSLLLSRYGLDAKPYNIEKKDITWEECSLRAWLNNDFLESAFTQEELSAIMLTTVDNGDSQGIGDWKTSGGNDTQDYLFLLSYVEANGYLDVKPDDSNNIGSRVAPTIYAKEQGAYTNDSNKTMEGEAAGGWWLRSPGRYQDSAAFVFDDGSLLNLSVSSVSVVVRPAFWLNLESDIF